MKNNVQKGTTKMSDERKEFGWLKVMINAIEEVYGGFYVFYIKKDDIDKLSQLYHQLIQPKPEPKIEIDEKYVEEKARKIIKITTHPIRTNSLSYRPRNLTDPHERCKDTIRQIISDVKA